MTKLYVNDKITLFDGNGLAISLSNCCGAVGGGIFYDPWWLLAAFGRLLKRGKGAAVFVYEVSLEEVRLEFR